MEARAVIFDSASGGASRNCSYPSPHFGLYLTGDFYTKNLPLGIQKQVKAAAGQGNYSFRNPL
jgi:hypothetical protein